jgi:hypothetical protein
VNQAAREIGARYHGGPSVGRKGRPITRVDTGDVYEGGAAQAALVLGVTRNAVRHAVVNRTPVRGIYFRFSDQGGRFSPRQATKRPVVCVTTGAEYGSIRSAARAVGAHPRNIMAAIERDGFCEQCRWRYRDGAAANNPRGEDNVCDSTVSVVARLSPSALSSPATPPQRRACDDRDGFSALYLVASNGVARKEAI